MHYRNSFFSPRFFVKCVPRRFSSPRTRRVTAWLVVRGLEYSIAPGGHDVPLAAVAASAEALVPLQLAELEIPQRVMFNNTASLYLNYLILYIHPPSPNLHFSNKQGLH